MFTRLDLVVNNVPENGTFLELGVGDGEFLKDVVLARPDIKYLGIDMWEDGSRLKRCATTIYTFGLAPSVKLLKSKFKDALKHPLVVDQQFDFIYIDGYAHTGQDNGETLQDWYCKLVNGGMFAGHDYDSQYQATIDAVNKFYFLRPPDSVSELKLTEEATLKSWYFRKL